MVSTNAYPQVYGRPPEKSLTASQKGRFEQFITEHLKDIGFSSSDSGL